ncbi:hypothetical protein Xcel_2062 [Xylanimonas cellulosilytica DSM 15894]|uniref:Uncharacterized protein n=1 Tax=Xylanimonas cellulosilytica (strain DSM 15894 / JCM 12276 / CECT 5975 / KCTC 9989 / LMG 20990 / NBRC 107835 / XIL07) TaxID=446471 RepID=D1BU67_XYLCX|nr:hypothetical protein [Xylanimonas cellulosilytica]ACZ31080.1 hypothetical protein Xcel_2062 [Xylanimonas cellulosilytica DSM 15894]
MNLTETTTTTAVRLIDGWHNVTDGTLTINGQPYTSGEPLGSWYSGLVRFHEPPHDDNDNDNDGAWFTVNGATLSAIRTRGPADKDDE